MTVQIAVKLPDDLVQALDELVAAGAFESRSSAVRQGVAAVVAAQRRQEIDRAYEAGYARGPETEEELREAARLAVESINDEPWDRWW